MSENLTAQTMHGTKWTYLSTVVSFVMQLVLTAILARLLAPAAFGLIAMAWLVLRFGQYFAQMGIGQAIVQRQEISRAHIAAGFWSSVAVGAVFSLAVWVAAPLASVLFESPQLVPVLRAMGLTFALSGTSAAAGALLRRQMRFRGMAIADMAAYAAGYGVVGVTLALSGWGVWSLVAASLGQAAVVTVAYNALARPSVVPVLNWRPYRDLLGFGSLVSVISFLEFVNANLDTLAVGRIAGPTSLGYYSRALSLTGLPLVYMGTSLSRVLFPSFSKIQAETARLGRAYLSVITVFAGVGLPIAFGMSGAAREIVTVVLGPQWSPSVPVMRLVAVGSAAALLSHFAGITLEATARLKEKVIVRLTQLVVFATLLLVLGRYGLTGFALAFVVSESFVYVLLAWRVTVDLEMSASEAIGAHATGLVGGPFAWAALLGESWLGLWLGLPAPIVLAVQCATGMLVLVITSLFVGSGGVVRVLDARTQGVVLWPFAARMLGWGMGVVEKRDKTSA